MKRIQKLIVGEEYVLADRPGMGGIADNNWVAGKVNIFKDDYSVFDGAGADSAYDGDISIARFDSESNVYLTEFLKKGSIINVSVQDYVAPILQRIDFDLSALTAVAGEEVGVRLVNTTNREVVYTGRRTYIIKSSGTLTTDIASVAAAITNDKFNDATAIQNGNVLEITAASFDPKNHVSEPFISASSVEGWSSVAGVVGVAAVSGVGTSDKVGLIESQEDWGESQGVSNFREFPVVPNSAVIAGQTYNLFTIEYNPTWGGNGGVQNGTTAPRAVIVAMASGGAGAALLRSNLETWLNVAIDDQKGN